MKTIKIKVIGLCSNCRKLLEDEYDVKVEQDISSSIYPKYICPVCKDLVETGHSVNLVIEKDE